MKFTFLLRQRWVVCRRLCHVTRISTTLGPWGLLVMWHWVVSVPSFELGVAVLCCGGSGVVACTGCEICIVRLCVMLGAWLCQWDDGGGVAHPWALVVVSGACPVAALVEVGGGGVCQQYSWLSRKSAASILSKCCCAHIMYWSTSHFQPCRISHCDSVQLFFNLLSISDQI